MGTHLADNGGVLFNSGITDPRWDDEELGEILWNNLEVMRIDAKRLKTGH